MSYFSVNTSWRSLAMSSADCSSVADFDGMIEVDEISAGFGVRPPAGFGLLLVARRSLALVDFVSLFVYSAFLWDDFKAN